MIGRFQVLLPESSIFDLTSVKDCSVAQSDLTGALSPVISPLVFEMRRQRKKLKFSKVHFSADPNALVSAGAISFNISLISLLGYSNRSEGLQTAGGLGEEQLLH